MTPNPNKAKWEEIAKKIPNRAKDGSIHPDNDYYMAGIAKPKDVEIDQKVDFEAKEPQEEVKIEKETKKTENDDKGALMSAEDQGKLEQLLAL